jgi:signal transduction histidine kinase
MRLLTPFVRGDTYRSLLFLLAAVPVAAVVLALLIAGWTTTLVLAITPLVIPLLVGFRGATGLLARVDAALARGLLGVETRPPIASGGRWFWGRGKAVLADGWFWRQQVYLSLRMTLGFAVAVGMATLLAGGLQALTYPIWYRWSSADFGSWHADTLPRSLLFVPAGALALLVGVHLIGPLGTLAGRLVTGLLGGGPQEAEAAPLSREVRRRALAFDAAVSGGIAGLVTLIWALTGGGYFWPEWVILPLALVVAIHGWVELVEERPRLRREPIVTRGLVIDAGVVAALVVFLTLVWALTGAGTFWPAWVLLAAVLVLGAHAAVNYAARGSRLARRVDVLEATRSGAVDAQDAELRRIERDLHDGAQARLVALGMSLGLAEQKLASDPEGAQRLVTEARVGVGEALQELRDLARGIHPPVLADRGLGAALATLADRSAVPVTLSVALDDRLAPSVESAAYFVVAEALANATKHSGASRIAVGVARLGDDLLEVQIEDDGRGGANPSGGGLTGLRRRVEALDGTLAVSSPAGGPTIVRAELPCGS